MGLIEALGRPQFLVGLRWGGVALALLALAALLLRGRGRELPVAGLGITAAAVAGLLQLREIPTGGVGGILLLAAGGAVAGLIRARSIVAPLLAVPGAWWLASSLGVWGRTWIGALVVVATALAGPLAAALDRGWSRSAAGPTLFAVSVLGVLVTVPDTEEALVLAGATLPISALGWPLSIARLGSAGAWASVGALLWVVATGGLGRLTSIVGGAACLGLLVIEPLARRMAGFEARPAAGPTPLTLVLAHGILVLFVSRVAGLRESLLEAVALAAGATLVAFLGTVFVYSRWGPGSSME